MVTVVVISIAGGPVFGCGTVASPASRPVCVGWENGGRSVGRASGIVTVSVNLDHAVSVAGSGPGGTSVGVPAFPGWSV